MTPRWAQRKEARLSDRLVSPDMFSPMVDCLGDFAPRNNGRSMYQVIHDLNQ